jgi:iron complex outermembrane receptor protein
MKQFYLATTAIAILATVCEGQASAQAQPAAGGKTQLEQIIVTAAHRKENLQKTAIAVTAVSAASLQAAGVVQARDLSKTVAGLSITASGAGSQIYLRGVGTFATDTYTSSPVSTNLDGVYLSMPPMINGVFYDLARVEVLKGPQGTLYGRNATAGAINIITTQPGPVMGGYATFEAGNYGLFKTAGAVNLPVNDQLDVRVAGQFLNRDGYYSDNTGRTGDDAARIQLRYKPNDAIELTLGADYQHATGQEEPLVVIGANPNNPWEGPTTSLSNADIIAARNPADPYGIGLPPFFSALLPPITSGDLGLRNDSAGVRADLEWNLGFANLSFISSYRHLATHFDTDPGFLSEQDVMAHQVTEELRLASPTDSGPWKWQAGLYYFSNSAVQDLFLNEGFTASPLNYTDRDSSAAAFGEITYSILPQLRLTGGLRGTTETSTQSGFGDDIYTPAAFSSFSAFLAASHTPGFLIPGIVDATLHPIEYSVSNGATFRNISVKAGAEYDVAPNSLAYANFTTGFKSGGIIPDLSTPLVSNVYKPETLDAYAIGSKNRFFGGSVQVNAEAFYWDYKNHQEVYLTQSQANPSLSLPLTHNIGDATVKGFSLDALYRPTPNDLLSGQLEYLDSTFDNFQYYEYTTPGYRPSTGCATEFLRVVEIAGQQQALNTVNCSGKPFTRAPHFSINLSLQHSFELGGDRGSLFAVISSHITTSQWLAVDYTPQEHEGGLTITDINLTYEPPNGAWSVTGYVHNIENTASYSSAFAYAFATNVTVGGINPPRTFGGIFKVRF